MPHARSLTVLLPTLLLALLLSGCGASLPTPGGQAAPLARSLDAMPNEAAAVTSAAALQILTPPLQSVGNVAFAAGAEGPSELILAGEGFAFTHSELHAYRPAMPGQTGLAAGKIGYTCPLDRRAEFLFLAEYENNGRDLVIRRLGVAPSFSTAPRVKVFVLRTHDLPRVGRIRGYPELVALLADTAVPPAMLQSLAGPVEVAVLAVSEDRVASDSLLTLGISGSSAGSTSYNRDCRTYSINGWPVAAMVGTIDPASGNDLYAKVTYKDAAQGRLARTSLLCVHKLAGKGE